MIWSLLLAASLAGQAEGSDIENKKHLARGINMDHIVVPYRHPDKGWTAEDDKAAADRLREEEFALISRLGFTHVRLCLGRAIFQEYEPPCRLREEGFKLLDRALDIAARQKLALVIDLHQVPVPPLDKEPDQRKAFRELWGVIAARCAKRDQPLFYELLNEPRVENPETWREIALELVGEIRKADPDRPIIVTGGGWGGLDQLLKVGLLDIPNLVYTFHFYDPFIFTHQGATWSGSEMKKIKGVRYPLDPDQIKTFEGKEPGKFKWAAESPNQDAMRESLKPAFALVKKGAVLYCGEFGVHKPYAPPEDRARWTEDLRSVLEEGGICWSMWSFHSGFDLVEKDGSPSPAIVNALGLGQNR